jgi:hypothetical protein
MVGKKSYNQCGRGRGRKKMIETAREGSTWNRETVETEVGNVALKRNVG